MSSHHFVKEGQEPPLLILSWTEKLKNTVYELLAWQPQIVVDAKILDWVLADDVKPDVVLDTENELPSYLNPIAKQSKSQFLKENLTATFILNSDDFDEILSYLSSKERVVYTEKFKIYFQNKFFEKIMPEGKQRFFLSGNKLQLIDGQREFSGLIFEEL